MYSVCNKKFIRPALLLAGLFATFGCEQTPTVVDTQVSFQLPLNDRAAQDDVVRLVVEAWPASLGVCEQFADWRQVVCNDTANAECPNDIDLQRRVPKEPQKRLEFTKTDGVWNFQALDLGEAQNIQVSIRGYDQDGKGLVYGCRGLELGQNIVVTLARPWCDQAVCLESFHPSCNAVIECNLQGSGTSSVAKGPICKAAGTSTTVYVWEENGEPCASIPTVFGEGARCQQAVVSCEAGKTLPIIDGVCPAEEAACVEGASYPDDDLNCDGVAPVSECSCSPGDSIECETVPGCFASSQCEANFQYGTCKTLTTTLTELCDGVDSNCNLVADDQEAEANRKCAAPGPQGEPLASQCTRFTLLEPSLDDENQAEPTTVFRCTCGPKKRACSNDGSGCCDNDCVDLKNNDDNCGGCGLACDNNSNCCDGACKNLREDTQNCGNCGTTCSGDSPNCCGGGCTSVKSDPANCGACGTNCSGDNPDCCDGLCKNFGTDAANCGTCGTVCPDTANTCCNGGCVNVVSDVDNCGTCGTSCGSAREGARCCGGQCINTNTNIQHCGGCFSRCNAGQRCSGGRCVELSSPDGGLSTKSDAKVPDSGAELIDGGTPVSRDSGGR